MRTWAAPLRDFGRLVLALQALAPALDGRDELREVDLERVEDLVGVVLGAEPDLALAAAGVLDDVLGRALGLLDDLLLGDQLVLAVARLGDDPLRLALGLGEHLLTLLDDPARLLDLLRDRRAHLVEDVVDLLPVQAHLVRARHHRALGVVDEVVELVDEYEDVHVDLGPGFRQRARASFNGPSTCLGTSSETSPPKMASSLTPLDERKLYWGLAMMKIDSISGACLRLSCVISASYSKSEIARSPLTIATAPFSRANSTTRTLNGSARTLVRWPVACSINAIRCSASKSDFDLRTEALTTAITTSSNSFDARVMTSRCPFVIGS